MISQTALDTIKTMDTTTETKIEEPNVTMSAAEHAVVSNIEDEQKGSEKPKRPGRKKRDVSSTSDIITENSDNTQPLFEQPVIVEGKRSRKPTARLELSDLAPPKKELSIPQGHGKPLGEIAYINYQIENASPDALSRMRNICFGRRGSQTSIKDNLREFRGFEFQQDSEEYQRHLNSLIKLKNDQLQSLSDILGLSSTGRHDEHAVKILNFLMNPLDEGKPIPERKMSMRNSKNPSINSKPSGQRNVGRKTENGNNDDDIDLFYYDDEEEEDDPETDDDYIGSDEESGLNNKDDDPDDFVYQPGKKTPKKRTSIKRSRKGTANQRKRAASTTLKRGRKRSKITADENIENDNGPIEPEQSMKQDVQKSTVDNSVMETNATENKNDNHTTAGTTQGEQHDTTNNNATEIIPATN